MILLFLGTFSSFHLSWDVGSHWALDVSSGNDDALSSVFMIVSRDCVGKMGGDFQLSVDLKVVYKK